MATPPNLTIVLAAQLITTDAQLSPSPQIITRSMNNPTLAATATFAQFYPQIAGSTVIPLPAATVALVYVRHLGTAGDLIVTYTPTGGSPQSIKLSPGTATGVGGGVFLYFCPNLDAPSGIIALTLAPSAGTIPCEVQVAY
jgi:hypothetical protein